jgi:hypothetical protein
MPRKGERAPKLLNAEIQAQIAALIADGTPWIAACRAAGLSRETSFRYRKRGRKERQPSPYRVFEVGIRRAERTAARRKAAEAEARARQRIEGLPGELREFLTDPLAIEREIAKVQAAAPDSGRTRLYVDRLRRLAGMFEPLPAGDLLTVEDDDTEDDLLLPWNTPPSSIESARRRLAEMHTLGKMDNLDSEVPADEAKRLSLVVG